MATERKTDGEISKDEEIAAVEKMLHDWRFILLHVDRWLKWEQDSYPGIMAGCVSALFFAIWYLEPSILTTVSLLAMVVCLIDYFLPRVFTKYIHTGEWVPDNQQQYQQICIGIVNTKNKVTRFTSEMKEMKSNKPKQYCALVLIVLGIIAFVGNAVPNFFLTYLFVLFMVLLPGLHHRGLLHKYYSIAVKQVLEALGRNKKKD
ncbi:ADP-ribosylation factor-like protein 6-interacting protein 1 [Anneissia japonica]|uniref:ADP-ribosylation factor-like protein 6-interacting protein 1 n=1 Tax=Anneissia japonica TaxID=1529436 RepID=UPI001425726F|nr:ADP-ribosylation factor-like protein 6-interacting protein 1 [Anneissia japonica]